MRHDISTPPWGFLKIEIPSMSSCSRWAKREKGLGSSRGRLEGAWTHFAEREKEPIQGIPIFKDPWYGITY